LSKDGHSDFYLLQKVGDARESQFREVKEEEKEMTRRGNGYLDEATERLRDEQEKDRDPQTAYEDQMSEESQDGDE
jgi:hypothetical protein|tara:strand:- start:7854 stop:8081 length:228 start_codon:yes stop_codon:yes gene_type:complete